MKKLVLLLSPFFFFFFLPFNKQEVKPTEKKQTTYFLVGGKTTQNLFDLFLEMAGGENAKIVSIPSATECDPSKLYTFKNKCTILQIFNKEDADKINLVGPIDSATGIWFYGGDQSRLMRICGNTLLQKKLHEFAKRGGIIGGTSAGASAMSEIMITGEGSETGFGLLPNFIIDQHFTERKRLNRLRNLVNLNPLKTGLGIDESTAVVLENDVMRVFGKGGVTVIKSKDLYVLSKE